GRVCYHPCERACNRSSFDEPIAIHCLERFVADRNLANHEPMPFLEGPKRERVAVVGSGPAGLSCAYLLARLGYQITIFDSHAEPGGMLRMGIPRYRLPRVVLDKEIDDIKALGVEFVLGKSFGEDFGWPDLNDYSATFIATGAHKERQLGIPGESAKGVMPGLKFLKDLSGGRKVSIGKKVVVIGGGNTAIDCARSALRLGSEVTVLYRRSRAEMPAVPDEVVEAEREGVRLQYLTAPMRFIVDREMGHVNGVECVRMRLGKVDETGRPRPVPIENSNFAFSADTILLAIGEDPNLEFLRSTLGDGARRIFVDEHQATNLSGLFAGGDAATNPYGTVVDAIRAGKEAARAIDQYLKWKPEVRDQKKLVRYEDLNVTYFKKEKRSRSKHAALRTRRKTFAEVNEGYSSAAALREVERCVSCGICTECNNCMIFCPDVAISKATGNGLYVIDYDHCKGCGICVAECPRSAMALKPEMAWR
ncbi:MAG: FAD-dependent oxidoreductase, partial [Bacteroidota bacterium]